MKTISNTNNYFELIPENIFVLGIVFCFSLSTFLFGFVIYSRKYKRYLGKKTSKIQIQVQELLSEIIFEDNLTIEKSIVEKNILNSKFATQIFKEEIIRLHKNLQGELSLKLETYFVSKNMHISSLKKIISKKEVSVISGLSELREMRMEATYSFIFDEFQKTKKVELKNHFIKTLIKLNPKLGLSILLESEIKLNDWLQISILNILEELHFTEVPNCELWLQKGGNFAIFGCRLSSFTKNPSDISHICSLLNLHNPELKIEAIKTLGILEADNVCEILKNIYLGEPLKVKEEILKTLEILKKKSNIDFLISCSLNDTHETQILAIKAVNSFIVSNPEILDTEKTVFNKFFKSTNNKYLSNVG